MSGRTKRRGRDAHRYLVAYPSGIKFDVSGGFGLIDVDGESVPVVDTGRDVVVLDPRAIVRAHATGRIVYHPDSNATLGTWAREWLDAHRAWAATR